MDTIKINRKSTLMIAHRGLSGIEKENTLAAFIAAGNRSYFGIETDVHKTADGKFIIIHDSNPERVSGISCIVEKTSFELLRKIYLKDIDNTSTRIDLRMPSLEEYIRICKKYNKICVLELKESFLEEDILAIAETIKDENYLDNVIFISFILENLILLRKHYPNQPAQYLLPLMTDKIWDTLIKYNLDIDIYENSLTFDIVKKAHELGKKVNCWTVNNADNGNKYAEYGVDYITTNILE